MTATGPNIRRRPAGPWTPAVAIILDDLAAADIHAPRHLNLHGNTETVTHLEGLVPSRPYPPEVLTDDALASVGGLLRQHHNALDPHPRPGTQVLPGWPDRPPDTVCHNDCGPWNIVYQHGKAVALIDSKRPTIRSKTKRTNTSTTSWDGPASCGSIGLEWRPSSPRPKRKRASRPPSARPGLNSNARRCSRAIEHG